MAEKQEVSSVVAMWLEEIETYERKFQPWHEKSKKIIKRYRNQRDEAGRDKSRFNILWSNVQTLSPAYYASPPTPNIDRRFENDDDLGRYSALVLERAVSYFVKNDIFDKVMKQVTLDRLLPGRGVSWVRYCPVIEEAVQVTEDAEDKTYGDEEQAEDVLLSEDVIPDYVHWEEFGHTWARTWQEVRGVWRRVCMGRAELVKRFGADVGNKIPMDMDGKTKGEAQNGKKAYIYEIWDKSKKKALWLHKAMPELLDEMEDPLGLKDFFPCPEPIYSTLSNDDLIPTPDYEQYQDQAIELDRITGRISAIAKAVKVVGVYDASAEGIDRLLSEGVENKLIPVQQWAVLGGGKGLDGAVSFFPLQEILLTLKGLYEVREQVKNDLYEITGISDIIRGSTDAGETATAQQIKGQYATLRLDNNQKDMARFSKDLVVIMTEIIAKHFSLDTIKAVSGVKLMTMAEKQQVEQEQAMNEMMAQQMPPHEGQPPVPQISEEMQEMLSLPTWEEVEKLIRSDTARCFRIDIETDSTIKTDQENEKQSRMEFLTAVGSFMQQAIMVPPDLKPLVMELLMFGVRGFKISRELETSFDTTITKLRKEGENPVPQPPSIEEIKAQLEKQKIQADQRSQEREMQMEQMRQQSDMAQMQAKTKADQQKAQQDLQASQVKAQQDMMLKNADIELKKLDLQIKTLDLQNKQQQVEVGLKDADEVKQTNVLLDSVSQGFEALANITTQSSSEIIKAIQNPPERSVIRDQNEKITGVK